MGNARQNPEARTAQSGLREVADGVLLAVRVQPRAARNQIGPVQGDALRVRVTAPPVESAANQAVARLLAEALKCPVARVELIRGHTSRNKVFKLHGLRAAQVVERLLMGTPGG